MVSLYQKYLKLPVTSNSVLIVTALFFDRQITYFLVNPDTFTSENFASSPSPNVNHLTITPQPPPPHVIQHSATMT